MVDFFSRPTIEESPNNPSSSPPHSGGDKEPVFFTGLVDVSFADSLLDFDSIEKELFEDNLQLDTLCSLDKVDIQEFEHILLGMDSVAPFPEETRLVDSVSRDTRLVEEGQLKVEPLGETLSCSIEAEMGRVSLVGCGDEVIAVKCEAEIEEEEEEEEEEDKETTLGSRAAEIEGPGEEVDACIVDSLLSSSSSAVDIGTGVINVIANGDRGDLDSDGESSSSASSSSSSDSSSSDDEEEEEPKYSADVKRDLKLEVAKQVTEAETAEGELEEGEIRDGGGDHVLVGSDDDDDDETTEADMVEKMVEWSDADDEDDGDVGVEKGPIRSKNELQLLPPVPPVNAVLLPHHQPQPVGLVSSVLGTQVIVEGVQKHNPLNEGSILWLTEKRSPLGLIDEIFGPVKNPFYIVRFNSESEVPKGICEGAPVSFVPEFADFVLSDQNLYKKGYDASGENDEELSDEVEFSDDEKEAEYRRMQKMSKRGMNNSQAAGNNKKRNKKKVQERQGVDWKHNHNNSNSNSNSNTNHNYKDKSSWQQARTGTSQNPHIGNQHNGPPAPALALAGNNGNAFVPTFPPVLQQQNPGHFNGNWPNGVYPQHQQNQAGTNFGGFPSLPGNIQNALQMVMQSIMPFQQQFNPGQGPLPGNVMLSGPPPNFFPSPGFMPWPSPPPPAGAGLVNQACFNLSPFGIGGFLPQPTNLTMNMRDQGRMAVDGSVQSLTNMSGSATQLSTPQRSGGQPPQNFNVGGGGGGMGFLPPPTNQSMNMGDQAMMVANGSPQSAPSSTGQSPPPPPLPQQSGNSLGGQVPRNFNVGSSRGRKPFHHRRGGGRFGGRGGR